MKSYHPVISLCFSKKHLSVFTCIAFALSLHAQTYYVKPGGAGSGASWAAAGDLQTIVNAAPAGSQVWAKAGTYLPLAVPVGSSGSGSRNFSFNLKNGVAVYGGFAGIETLLSQRNYTTNVTILSGDVGTAGNYTDDCYHVIMSVGNNNTAILDGFTVANGYANGGASVSYGGQTLNQNTGGGVITYNGSPVIRNCIFNNNLAVDGGSVYNRNSGTAPLFGSCTFSNNSATGTGGSDGGAAAYNYSSSTLVFDTCKFTSNTVSGYGGAIYNSGGLVTVDTCAFTGNTAALDGGAIYGFNSASANTITRSSFSSDTATGSGGAIAVTSTSWSISNSTFTGNASHTVTASNGGGAVYGFSNSSTPTVNCTFTSNTADSYGGAICYNSGSNSTVTGSVFSSNQAIYGGGLATISSTPTVSNCRFSNGAATYGGGVYNITGTPTFSVDTFSNNTATSTSGMGGGGVVNDGANCTYSHCWFHGNVTNGADGAGQYDNGSAAPVDSSCVFEANIAKGTVSNGGGICHNGGGNSKTFNCVFVDNSCKENGGGYYDNASSSTIENCTVYNNTAVTGAGIYDVGGGSTKFYANMVWNNHPDGVAVGAGSTSGWKMKYNNFQAAFPPGGNSSITNNTFGIPTFYNSGSYTGSNGKWADGDDGLHLAPGSVGTAIVPYPGNVMADDITTGPRPYVAGFANEGAYESPGFVLLPVNLISFLAAPSASNAVAVQWRVDAAAQASVYELQKSVNGTAFSPIGTIDAVPLQSYYAYTDLQAGEGTLYYRLKLVNGDKSVAYSSVAIVHNAVFKGQLALWPSLIKTGTATLFIGGVSIRTNLLVTVTDVSGRVLLRKNIAVEQGDNNMPLDITRFGKGVYFLGTADAAGFQKVLPFEKQ